MTFSPQPNSPEERFDPHVIYRERKQSYEEQRSLDGRKSDRLSLWRGLLFLGSIGVGIALYRYQLSLYWLFLPFVIFLALVVAHGIVRRRMDESQRGIAWYVAGLARVTHDWERIEKTAPTGERYRDEHHPYSSDLDLFGNQSLFQLLSTSRTRLGEDCLSEWLLMSATPEEISSRQEAIEELRNNIGLREQLGLLTGEVHDGIDQNQLKNWATEPDQLVPCWIRLAGVVISVGLVGGFVLWQLTDRFRSFFFIFLMLTVLFVVLIHRRIRRTMQSVEKTQSGLDILAKVLSIFEAQSFESGKLSQLVKQLHSENELPSLLIGRLDRRIQQLFNSLKNQFYAPVAFVLGLPIHFVHAIELWRKKIGKEIPIWLDSVSQLESLCSLASFAFEHPQYPFPEIRNEAPCFMAEKLGHVLIDPKVRVANDIQLDHDLRMVLISGSNMSGKSTMLRTIGTNLTLALAGAPVCASRLQLTQLQLGTAIRIHDSLQEGMSLFYSGIKRLKQILDLTSHEIPVLFLLDEILQGTNSHDRRIGAESVIRGLLSRGAIGLVTTHDLALTEIINELSEGARNLHFQDHIENGKMSFDYCLQPGVVEKSNALELMRLVGLEISPTD